MNQSSVKKGLTVKDLVTVGIFALFLCLHLWEVFSLHRIPC